MKSFKFWAQVVCAAMGALLLSDVVFAQGIPNLSDLTAATPAGDWSIKMWKSLFGAFATNPFSTLGAPTTLLGTIFVIFNGCIFVVGFTWAMYGIMSGVVATAHEGEVLGKRMSSIWFPIRMITGISGMVPVFGGFTLTQAIMMMLTTLGIGIGNAMWKGAVNSSDQFQAMMQSESISPTGAAQVRESAYSLFISNVCLISERANAEHAGRAAENQPVVSFVLDAESSARTMSFGTKANPQLCGYFASKASVRSGSNPLAFRSGAVDYSAIENQANLAANQQMELLQASIDRIATKWYVDREAAITAAKPVPSVPLNEIDAAAKTFVVQVAQKTQNEVANKTHAIKDAARANMLRIGWFGAGAWYSTFAELNAGIADAAKGPSMSARDGDPILISSTTRETMEAARRGMRAAEADRNTDASVGDPTKAVMDGVIKDSCNAMASSFMGTATGNCSFGQAIVSTAIHATATGSGGGGNGSGSLAFDSEGLVNPVIMMKNMGDYVLTASTSILTAGPVLAATAKAGDAVAGYFADSTLPGVSTVAKGAKSIMSTYGQALAILQTIAMVTLVLGAAMSIYIPMIPFITWMGAILAYAASMIEGLAGATLHAMAHLEADGDGMGQRTTHGYMFYINAVARPALMIIGFFVASALLVAIGTLQANLFLPAMANVQGNSVTGLASIAMFLLIFFVINLTLITACFNLIYVITDQVIGFVGGQVDSKLGRDTEDKVNNMFLMSARVGPSAIAQGSAARAAARKSAAEAGGGASKKRDDLGDSK